MVLTYRMDMDAIPLPDDQLPCRDHGFLSLEQGKEAGGAGQAKQNFYRHTYLRICGIGCGIISTSLKLAMNFKGPKEMSCIFQQTQSFEDKVRQQGAAKKSPEYDTD